MNNETKLFLPLLLGHRVVIGNISGIEEICSIGDSIYRRKSNLSGNINGTHLPEAALPDGPEYLEVVEVDCKREGKGKLPQSIVGCSSS